MHPFYRRVSFPCCKLALFQSECMYIVSNLTQPLLFPGDPLRISCGPCGTTGPSTQLHHVEPHAPLVRNDVRTRLRRRPAPALLTPGVGRQGTSCTQRDQRRRARVHCHRLRSGTGVPRHGFRLQREGLESGKRPNCGPNHPTT